MIITNIYNVESGLIPEIQADDYSYVLTIPWALTAVRWFHLVTVSLPICNAVTNKSICRLGRRNNSRSGPLDIHLATAQILCRGIGHTCI